jgi:hypothetical protein
MTEGPNPYAAPRADIAPAPASPSRRTGWKVYAFGVVALQLVGLFFALRKISVAEALDYAVTAVGIIGLFGYAYRRPFWGRRIWMLWGALFPVWDIVMGAWVYPRQNGTGVHMIYFLAMLLFLPQYLAVIRYGYSSRELWSEAGRRSAG